MHHRIYKKVALVILDGFGIAPAGRGNAIAQGDTPTLDYIAGNFPCLTLQASGPLVGLPWGEVGNSEVGHLNIGAGRIVGQDLPRINTSIQDREFFKNPSLLQCLGHVKENNSALHLVGMVSPGGVHSLDQHLYALLGLAAEQGQKKVFIHMFTDGRDTQPKIALESLAKLNEKIAQIGVGQIATIAGRFYGMDRAGHWAQTMLVFKALVDGQGEKSQKAEEAVSQAYQAQIFDEMIKPTVIVDLEGAPLGKISDNDGVVFFNFRSDRALQLAQALCSPQVVPQELAAQPPKNLFFVSLTQYAADLPVKAAFEPLKVKNPLAEVIAANKFSQFHIAESEKSAHVTSFFNCGRTEIFPQEGRIIVTSPSNASNYSDLPKMSAEPLTKILEQKILGSDINFFVANFANGDMVGHTGNLTAAVSAVEFLDECLKKILDACLAAGAVLIITADHGNVEQMINPKTGDIDKDHTTAPVPFLLIAEEFKFSKPADRDFGFLCARVPAGALCDVAPTVLDLFGLPEPQEMAGINLLDEIDEVPRANRL